MYDWHKKTGRAYVTSGVGYGKTALSAFDAAEVDANILATNAVKVSSFIPPHWRIINRKEELGKITANGAFLPMAYATAVSKRTRVAASVIIGMNRDTTKASIITEHAGEDLTKEQSLQQSTTCIEDMFGCRGWEIDRLEEVSVEAAPKDGLYVCVLVAVVFLVDQPQKEAAGTS